MTTLALPAYAQLSEADEAALTELYRRGTPADTLHAWERDHSRSAFGERRPQGWAGVDFRASVLTRCRFIAVPDLPRSVPGGVHHKYY